VGGCAEVVAQHDGPRRSCLLHWRGEIPDGSGPVDDQQFVRGLSVDPFACVGMQVGLFFRGEHGSVMQPCVPKTSEMLGIELSRRGVPIVRARDVEGPQRVIRGIAGEPMLGRMIESRGSRHFLGSS